MTEQEGNHGDGQGGSPAARDLHFFVDGQKIANTEVKRTGSQIKAKANVQQGYQLFLEEQGDNPDRPIGDADEVSLEQHHPRHFFAVPPATFGQR